MTERTSNAGGVLAALGKSAAYLALFLGSQVLVSMIYMVQITAELLGEGITDELALTEALLERMTLEEVRRLWQEQKEAEEAREKEEQTEEERAEETQGASLPEETQTQEGLTREETREEEPEPSPGEIQVELEEMEPIVVEVGPIDALPADSGEKR